MWQVLFALCLLILILNGRALKASGAQGEELEPVAGTV